MIMWYLTHAEVFSSHNLLAQHRMEQSHNMFDSFVKIRSVPNSIESFFLVLFFFLVGLFNFSAWSHKQKKTSYESNGNTLCFGRGIFHQNHYYMRIAVGSMTEPKKKHLTLSLVQNRNNQREPVQYVMKNTLGNAHSKNKESKSDPFNDFNTNWLAFRFSFSRMCWIGCCCISTGFVKIPKQTSSGFEFCELCCISKNILYFFLPIYSFHLKIFRLFFWAKLVDAHSSEIIEQMLIPRNGCCFFPLHWSTKHKKPIILFDIKDRRQSTEKRNISKYSDCWLNLLILFFSNNFACVYFGLNSLNRSI